MKKLLIGLTSLLMVGLTNCSPTKVTGNSSDVGNANMVAFCKAAQFRTDCATLDFGSDTSQFNLIRGEEAAFRISFSFPFDSAPLVFAVPTSRCADVTMSIRSVSLKAFDLYFALSSNSSSAQVASQQVIDWLAVPASLKLSGINYGKGQFAYNLTRGHDTTITVQFPAKGDPNFVVLVMSTCRAKDLFVSVGNKTTTGFNLTLTLSGNASQPVATDTYSFCWLALPSPTVNASIQTSPASTAYSINRGDSSITALFFPKQFISAPIILFTPTCLVKDIYVNTINKDTDHFGIMLNLSGNSSAPSEQGIFTFDWVALAR